MQRSDSIANLAAALVKVQAALGPVKKDTRNPFFDSMYADLGSIIDASRKLLTENGLVVTQLPGPSRLTHDAPDKEGNPVHYGVVSLTTLVIHTSGEWIEELSEIPCRFGDPQRAMAAWTYLRRGAMQAVVGIAAEEDDDGNVATRGTQGSQERRSGPSGSGDTSEESRGSCSVHGVPFRHNVGTDRNDKPYDFWGCPQYDEVDGKRVYCKERPPKRDMDAEKSQAASAPPEGEGNPSEMTATEWTRHLKTELKARGVTAVERRKLIADWARDRSIAHVPADEDWNAALYKDFWAWLTNKEKEV